MAGKLWFIKGLCYWFNTHHSISHGAFHQRGKRAVTDLITDDNVDVIMTLAEDELPLDGEIITGKKFNFTKAMDLLSAIMSSFIFLQFVEIWIWFRCLDL